MKIALLAPVTPYLLAAIISLMSGELSTSIGVVFYNMCRVGLLLWVGWATLSLGKSGLLGAAIAGVMLFCVEHLLVTGGLFLMQGHIQAAFGVGVSFIMFTPLAAFFGYLGGLFAKYQHST